MQIKLIFCQFKTYPLALINSFSTTLALLSLSCCGKSYKSFCNDNYRIILKTSVTGWINQIGCISQVLLDNLYTSKQRNFQYMGLRIVKTQTAYDVGTNSLSILHKQSHLNIHQIHQSYVLIIINSSNSYWSVQYWW